nr:MAG TPA: hypothetical protein [Caudoviricetes sp.]
MLCQLELRQVHTAAVFGCAVKGATVKKILKFIYQIKKALSSAMMCR